ncbi:MAG: glycosyltransferase, partial [Bacteroidota bacterium]
DIPAVIVGPVMAKDYHQQLLDTIAEHNLSVTIVPGLPKKEVLQVIRKSWFTCSLYHTSNLGNVFLEGLTMGKAILAINYNHSLDVIDADAYHGVSDDNVHEGVLALWEDPELIKSLEKKAELFADQTLGSWDTRAEKEIQLLVAD